jgi:16S rRNA (uracil1498-N3)-methyltransferase
MQLFIKPFIQQNNNIKIIDRDMINQCMRVLRAKKWFHCYIQQSNIRHLIVFDIIEHDNIIATIKETNENTAHRLPITIIIWSPNKFSKHELIVQKLTEIGVETICFVNMRRSVVNDISIHKKQRLDIIAKEAMEQSRSWSMPKIQFYSREQMIQQYKPQQTFYLHTSTSQPIHTLPCMIYNNAIVWPEWWFDELEIAQLNQLGYIWVSFATNILRTETAAICAWYQLCSLSC